MVVESKNCADEFVKRMSKLAAPSWELEVSPMESYAMRFVDILFHKGPRFKSRLVLDLFLSIY